MQAIKRNTRIKAAVGITLGVIAGIALWWVITSIIWGIVVGFVAALTLSTLFSFKKIPQHRQTVAKVVVMN